MIKNITNNKSTELSYRKALTTIGCCYIYMSLAAIQVSAQPVATNPEGSTPTPTLTTTTTTLAGSTSTTTSTTTTTTTTTTSTTTTSTTSTTTTTVPSCNMWTFSIYVAGLKRVGDSQDGNGSGSSLQPPAVPSAISNWLSQEIQAAWDRCLTWFPTQRTRPANWRTNLMDECVVGWFTGLSTFNMNYPDRAPRLTPFGGRWNSIDWRSYGATTGTFINANASGTILFDSARNSYATAPAGAYICDAGSYGWMGSPISLLWDNDANVDAEITITSFPVDPTTTNKWHLWKASGKAPLLVYDPEHTGRITSGEQLFGNWTFGGKQLASLINNTETHNVSKWKDGFEALSTLDRNDDKRISGSELKDLGLWFDYNQDGIADKGEVKSVSEAGVTTLYYSPDRVEKATNNIIATKGFERTENGKTITGTAIDWHSDSAASKEELFNKHLAHAMLCNQEDKSNISEKAEVDAIEQDSTAKKTEVNLAKTEEKIDITKNIAGLWLWVSDDDEFKKPVYAPKGYFTLSHKENNEVSGHTWSEISFPMDLKGIKSALNINPLRGKASIGADKKTSIRFIVQAPGNTTIVNTATLSEDGLELIGKSRATVNYANSPVTVVYTWRAVREQLPSKDAQLKLSEQTALNTKVTRQ